MFKLTDKIQKNLKIREYNYKRKIKDFCSSLKKKKIHIYPNGNCQHPALQISQVLKHHTNEDILHGDKDQDSDNSSN